MPDKIWNYETLARATKPELEHLLKTKSPPRHEDIEGYIYGGWNLQWFPRVIGAKFKKGFLTKEGKPFGYNEIVVQDGKGPLGIWESRIYKNGKPRNLGFFEPYWHKDEEGLPIHEPYMNCMRIKYTTRMNKGIYIFFRMIHDYAVQVNDDDPGLLLCKAYMRFWPRGHIFYSYFPLGHREKITHFPW